ncbi:MAG: IclR family transcriptional regulator C-terminal domain-containing protein [Burkholderiales bacterium]
MRRHLYTLGKLGLVGGEDGRTFSLLPKTKSSRWATRISSSTLASFAQPLLDRVSERSGESSSIAILDGIEIIYVARSSITQRIMSVDLSIGTRLPAYCTSMGRALLADLAPSELDAYLRRVKLVAHTPKTVVARSPAPGAGRRREGRLRDRRPGARARPALDRGARCATRPVGWRRR